MMEKNMKKDVCVRTRACVYVYIFESFCYTEINTTLLINYTSII